MEFYTYIWRDASGVPFYVGKGKGRRAYDTWTRSADFKSIHGKGGCTVEIVDTFIHESQAHALEVELIAKYGRRVFGGLLINKTDGGEGQSGLYQSREKREKISRAKLGQKHSPETRAKISSAQLGKIVPDDVRLKISAGHVGKKRSPDAKENMSRAAKTRPAEHLDKIVASIRLTPPPSTNKSGFKGVSFFQRTKKWRAGIGTRTIGYYDRPEDAAIAYDKAAIELWGSGNCYLNFPDLICAAPPKTRTRSEAMRMLPSAAGRMKGVRQEKRSGNWVARIKISGIEKYLGTFDTPESAAAAYDRAAVAAWGEGKCFLNFPREAQNG